MYPANFYLALPAIFIRGHSFDDLDVKDVGYVIVSGHLQLFDHWADDMVSELRLPK